MPTTLRSVQRVAGRQVATRIGRPVARTVGGRPLKLPLNTYHDHHRRQRSKRATPHTLENDLTDTVTTTTDGALSARTMEWLNAYFAEKDHHPSTEHLAALKDIADTMERMADGVCDQKVFLSSVDCGVGKSSTALAFVRTLMNSPDHSHVGMIICVGRLAEAEALASELTAYQDCIAVLTHETAADLTPEMLDKAQLLITTQQRTAVTWMALDGLLATCP